MHSHRQAEGYEERRARQALHTRSAWRPIREKLSNINGLRCFQKRAASAIPLSATTPTLFPVLGRPSRRSRSGHRPRGAANPLHPSAAPRCMNRHETGRRALGTGGPLAAAPTPPARGPRAQPTRLPEPVNTRHQTWGLLESPRPSQDPREGAGRGAVSRHALHRHDVEPEARTPAATGVCVSENGLSSSTTASRPASRREPFQLPTRPRAGPTASHAHMEEMASRPSGGTGRSTPRNPPRRRRRIGTLPARRRGRFSNLWAAWISPTKHFPSWWADGALGGASRSASIVISFLGELS